MNAQAAAHKTSAPQTPSLPNAKPEAIGLSGARLQKLSDAFKREVDNGTLPGATVLVAATVRFTGPDTGANTTGQTTPGSDGGGTATGDPDSGGTGDRTQRFRLRVLLTDSDGGPKLAAVQYLP